MRNYGILSLLILACTASTADARTASLKGGRESQKRQNREADRSDLTRFASLAEVKRFVRSGLLVPIKDTDAYVIGPQLGHLDPDNVGWYRHARPWTKTFLDKELGAGHAATGEVFRITSLVRTRAYQRLLVRTGGNAISGKRWWKQSSHLTGATVDISYKDMSPKARKWLEKRLLALERKGLIEATKEHRSACFHIMVFPRYAEREARTPSGKHKTRKR